MGEPLVLSVSSFLPISEAYAPPRPHQRFPAPVRRLEPPILDQSSSLPSVSSFPSSSSTPTLHTLPSPTHVAAAGSSASSTAADHNREERGRGSPRPGKRLSWQGSATNARRSSTVGPQYEDPCSGRTRVVPDTIITSSNDSPGSSLPPQHHLPYYYHGMHERQSSEPTAQGESSRKRKGPVQPSRHQGDPLAFPSYPEQPSSSTAGWHPGVPPASVISTQLGGGSRDSRRETTVLVDSRVSEKCTPLYTFSPGSTQSSPPPTIPSQQKCCCTAKQSELTPAPASQSFSRHLDARTETGGYGVGGFKWPVAYRCDSPRTIKEEYGSDSGLSGDVSRQSEGCEPRAKRWRAGTRSDNKGPQDEVQVHGTERCGGVKSGPAHKGHVEAVKEEYAPEEFAFDTTSGERAALTQSWHMESPDAALKEENGVSEWIEASPQEQGQSQKWGRGEQGNVERLSAGFDRRRDPGVVRRYDGPVWGNPPPRGSGEGSHSWDTDAVQAQRDEFHSQGLPVNTSATQTYEVHPSTEPLSGLPGPAGGSLHAGWQQKKLGYATDGGHIVPPKGNIKMECDAHWEYIGPLRSKENVPCEGTRIVSPSHSAAPIGQEGLQPKRGDTGPPKERKSLPLEHRDPLRPAYEALRERHMRELFEGRHAVRGAFPASTRSHVSWQEEHQMYPPSGPCHPRPAVEAVRHPSAAQAVPVAHTLPHHAPALPSKGVPSSPKHDSSVSCTMPPRSGAWGGCQTGEHGHCGGVLQGGQWGPLQAGTTPGEWHVQGVGTSSARGPGDRATPEQTSHKPQQNPSGAVSAVSVPQKHCTNENQMENPEEGQPTLPAKGDSDSKERAPLPMKKALRAKSMQVRDRNGEDAGEKKGEGEGVQLERGEMRRDKQKGTASQPQVQNNQQQEMANELNLPQAPDPLESNAINEDNVGQEGEGVEEGKEETEGGGRQNNVPSDQEQLWSALRTAGLLKEEIRLLLGRLKAAGKTLTSQLLLDNLKVLESFNITGCKARAVVKGSPGVTAMATPDLEKLLNLLVQARVRYDRLGNVLSACGAVNGDVEKMTEATVSYLSSLKVKHVGSMLEQCPKILVTPMAVLQRNVALIRDAVGSYSLGKVLEQNAGMLEGTDGDSVVINFLLQDCAVARHQLASILERKAFFRGATLVTLRERLRALQDIVGKENIPEVLQREPGILSTGVDTIHYNRKRLKELMPEDEVKQFVVKYPRLLRFNWEHKVRPTLEFLATTCNLCSSEVLWAGVFAYSLDKTIKPRIQFLVDNGVKIIASRKQRKKDAEGSEPGTVCLSSAITRSSSSFAKTFGALNVLCKPTSVLCGEETIDLE